MSRMAPEFWPASQATKRGRISGICNPFCGVADGQKDKPDGALIYAQALSLAMQAPLFGHRPSFNTSRMVSATMPGSSRLKRNLTRTFHFQGGQSAPCADPASRPSFQAWSLSTRSAWRYAGRQPPGTIYGIELRFFQRFHAAGQQFDIGHRSFLCARFWLEKTDTTSGAISTSIHTFPPSMPCVPAARATMPA